MVVTGQVSGPLARWAFGIGWRVGSSPPRPLRRLSSSRPQPYRECRAAQRLARWAIVTGTLRGIQTCAPPMRDSGGGSIINIGSIAGITGNVSTAYSSSLDFRGNVNLRRHYSVLLCTSSQ